MDSIVKTLGFSSTVTLLITAPVYVFGFFTSFGNSLLPQHTDKRAILIVWPLIVDIVGNVMLITTRSTAPRYVGMFLMCAGSYSAFNVVQAWIASTVPRTRTKPAIMYAMVNLFGNSSNIYWSYFFPSSDEPQYRMGGIILSLGLGLWLRQMNKKASQQESMDGQRR
ncbi:hypothetical protein N7478_005231 [Penicillium angulare]|uniref:uncharacterized protein n=1 Tax=Penicillium angulare TaxID=116970 RepID=UPI002541AFF4|nr:uncharacterized protein N7478_005231 [Penicillium angulare]KAJ5279859.1 hypothetical protein N7478_005231 [Penicillium angulare]